MRLDQYKNPIFNSQDVFKFIYQNKIDKLKDIFVDLDSELEQFISTSELNLSTPPSENKSIKEFDFASQNQWFMPESYARIDIDSYVLSKIDMSDQLEVDRIIEELQEFKKRNMYQLLQWLIYFVDTCTDHNIVWGVGRGSSVSSYVLYLIGVHKINSIKFNLPWSDFLR